MLCLESLIWKFKTLDRASCVKAYQEQQMTINHPDISLFATMAILG